MDTPYLSLALATYNRWHELEPMLRALLPQLDGDVELIVSDNASPDGSAQRAEDFCKDAPNVHILRHEKNVGAVLNFRDAAEAARGEFVMFLGDDDLPSPNFIAFAKSVLRTHPGYGLYHFVPDPRGKPLSVREFGPGADAINLVFSYSGMMPGVTFPRRFFSRDLWPSQGEIYPQVLLASSLARDHGALLAEGPEGLTLGGATDTAVSRARSRPTDFGIGERLRHLRAATAPLQPLQRAQALQNGVLVLLTWGWNVFDELQAENPKAAQQYLSALTTLPPVSASPYLLTTWLRHAALRPAFFLQTAKYVLPAVAHRFLGAKSDTASAQ